VIQFVVFAPLVVAQDRDTIVDLKSKSVYTIINNCKQTQMSFENTQILNIKALVLNARVSKVSRFDKSSLRI
jgi:hypothetical protein